VVALVLPASAQAQVSFNGPTWPATAGGANFSLAVADLDGDSDLDVVGANFYDSRVSVLLGDGHGAFATSAFNAGEFPGDVAVGDFDADSDPDLAVVNSRSGTVSVLLGDGHGSFGAPTAVTVGGTPGAVTVGDFNGDGDPDLAVAMYTWGQVVVLLGQPDGAGFAAPVGFPVGAKPDSVVVADFDGDQDADLAVANEDSDNVSVLLGDGHGAFAAAPGSPIAVGDRPLQLVVSDFNGDSDPDLAVVNIWTTNVSILLGRPGGADFETAPTVPGGYVPCAIAVGDFNGDSDPDLVVANNRYLTGFVTVMLGGAGGSFGPGIERSVGDRPDALATGDFDADGDADLAVNTRSVNLAVLWANRAPRVVADEYATDEETVLTVDTAGVLGNDADPEGDSVTARLESDPAHGSLDFAADGSFVYTPDPDWNGQDSFSYRATDGGAESGPMTVTIDVGAVNDTPTADDDAYVTDEDVPLTVAASGVLGNDGDVDGDPLTASVTSGAGHGSVELTADGSFTYTPDPHFNGTDSFGYRANDGSLDSAIATVTIEVTPVDEPPVGTTKPPVGTTKPPVGTAQPAAGHGCLRAVSAIVGTDGDDTRIGTAASDIMFGGLGDDVLRGRGGVDCLDGQHGKDRLRGGTGRDRLYGGPGADRISGGTGADRLDGGAGSDRVTAGPGNDLVIGRGSALDTIDCGPGHDVAIVDRTDRTRRCEEVRRG